MADQHYLIVMADDYGIGPPTSQAILDLAARGSSDSHRAPGQLALRRGRGGSLAPEPGPPGNGLAPLPDDGSAHRTAGTDPQPGPRGRLLLPPRSALAPAAAVPAMSGGGRDRAAGAAPAFPRAGGTSAGVRQRASTHPRFSTDCRRPRSAVRPAAAAALRPPGARDPGTCLAQVPGPESNGPSSPCWGSGPQPSTTGPARRATTGWQG